MMIPMTTRGVYCRVTVHFLSLLLLAICLISSFAIAETVPDIEPAGAPVKDVFHQRYMFNWGPERERLADKGVTFDFFYWNYALGDPNHPSGTKETFGGFQRVRGTVDVDFGKFTAAKGLSYHVTGLWQTGQNMGAVLGSIVSPNSIASIPQFRLDSTWLSQKLAHDKVTVMGGLMASRDFYGFWGNGAYFNEAMTYSFGNLGNVRASADPSTGPGAEIRFSPTKRVTIKTGYMLPMTNDVGAGGKILFPTGFNYHSGSKGSTWNTEAAVTTAQAGKYAGVVRAGLIYNGGKFYNYSNGKNESNFLFYSQLQQPVYRASGASARGLDLTAGLTTGPTSKSENPTEALVGLCLNGPLTARPKDSVAVAFIYSTISDQYNAYLRANPAVNPLCGLSGCIDEKFFEVNYKAVLTPWLVLQPTYQHISNVGGRKTGAADLGGIALLAWF